MRSIFKSIQMVKEKLDSTIQKQLFSADSEKTILGLKAIKERGNKMYLPMLFDLLLSEPEENVKHEILKLLGSVKKKDAVPIFIAALKNEKYRPLRKKLLTACWQNGLDFTDHLPLFVDCIIEEEWATGFEAFTVVENMKSYPNQEIVHETSSKINRSLPHCNDKKTYFLQEILHMIR